MRCTTDLTFFLGNWGEEWGGRGRGSRNQSKKAILFINHIWCYSFSLFHHFDLSNKTDTLATFQTLSFAVGEGSGLAAEGMCLQLCIWKYFPLRWDNILFVLPHTSAVSFFFSHGTVGWKASLRSPPPPIFATDIWIKYFTLLVFNLLGLSLSSCETEKKGYRAETSWQFHFLICLRGKARLNRGGKI